jgi:SAM-dependent methyltransferase
MWQHGSQARVRSNKEWQLTSPSPKNAPRPITDGTNSWRKRVDSDHDLLADFLEDVAATETIQSAIELAVQRMRPAPRMKALDVGCGTGVYFSALAEAIGPGGIMAGIDHGAGFLEDARKRGLDGGYADQLQLVLGDAEALPFRRGSFDAAHTERVLMHLADPDLAIRELRRVVRPGGWIVCVEPDLTGMRLDHPRPELASCLVAGFCASIQNPSMGLELNRRFAMAGLLDRTIDVLTEVERTYQEDVAEFFARAAETAIAKRWLTREEADSALIGLLEAGDSGYFTSYSSMFVVAGQVPRESD